jgi:hypothetical protein
VRYLFAIVWPPLAIIDVRQTHFCLNAAIWVADLFSVLIGFGLILWVIFSIHALIVVNSSAAHKRNRELIRAVGRSR